MGVLPQERFSILFGPPLREALRTAEVYRYPGGHREGAMRGHFMNSKLDQDIVVLRCQVLQLALEPLDFRGDVAQPLSLLSSHPKFRLLRVG
jgi:hypothetical protein